MKQLAEEFLDFSRLPFREGRSAPTLSDQVTWHDACLVTQRPLLPGVACACQLLISRWPFSPDASSRFRWPLNLLRSPSRLPTAHIRTAGKYQFMSNSASRIRMNTSWITGR